MSASLAGFIVPYPDIRKRAPSVVLVEVFALFVILVWQERNHRDLDDVLEALNAVLFAGTAWDIVSIPSFRPPTSGVFPLLSLSTTTESLVQITR